MLQRLLSFLPAIVWMGVIFYFSSQSSLVAAPTEVADFTIKKLAHVTVFFILFILFYCGFASNRLQKSFLSSLSYAFTDEIHQLFTPARSASLSDVLIDSLGTILAYFVIKSQLWKRLKPTL